MKHLKGFNEGFNEGFDLYQSHWIKFSEYLYQNGLIYDNDILFDYFSEVANDDTLSADEKALDITQFIDNDFGFNNEIDWINGFSDISNFLERLFMD